MFAIETQNLTMEFPLTKGVKKQALGDLNLKVSCGKIFGFLGHNGAGKTTTIKILLDLCRPTKGWAKILGIPSDQALARKPVGFLPEEPAFYDYLTALESVESSCRLHGILYRESKSLAYKALQEVGLEKSIHLPIYTFSKGMKQRLALAHACVHNPEIMILDEPMSGMDPEGRMMLKEKMLLWKEKGKTLFFTSHILSDVEALCEEVALLFNGKCIAEGKPKDFLKKEPIGIQVILEEEQVFSMEFPFPIEIEKRDKKAYIFLKDKGTIEKMKSFLQEKKIFPDAWTPQYETLEECYFRLMKGNIG